MGTSFIERPVGIIERDAATGRVRFKVAPLGPGGTVPAQVPTVLYTDTSEVTEINIGVPLVGFLNAPPSLVGVLISPDPLVGNLVTPPPLLGTLDTPPPLVGELPSPPPLVGTLECP